MFATMMFLDFDLDKRILRYSSAGHNPLLFHEAKTQACQMIGLRGPALALSKLSKYQEKEIPLEQGNLFLIYTDGVTEAFNKGREMFEETRLTEALQQMASSSAKAIITNVKSRLDEFTGGAPQSDDVAMIAVKIL